MQWSPHASTTLNAIFLEWESIEFHLIAVDHQDRRDNQDHQDHQERQVQPDLMVPVVVLGVLER